MRRTSLCYIERDGQYLMLYRNKKKNDGSRGKWLGIGGKLEPGETPDECVQREVREETGLELVHFWSRGTVWFYSDLWEDEIMYLYSADEVSGELAESCDEGELRWVPIEEVPELNLWEGDRIFLRQMAEGRNDIRLSVQYKGDELVGWREL